MDPLSPFATASAPGTAGSSEAAAPDPGELVGFPELEDELEGPDELRCEHCGTELVYAGRGPKPRFCQEHKDRRNRTDKPAAASSSSSPARKGKKDPSAAYGIAWAGAGYLIANRLPEPVGPPVGRVMQLQAGDAGPRLHRILSPYVDRIGFLKKLGENSKDLTDAAALFLPPLLVAAVSLELVPEAVVGPLLAQVLRPMAAELVRAQREQAEHLSNLAGAEDEVNEALSELFAGIFGPPTVDGTPA